MTKLEKLAGELSQNSKPWTGMVSPDWDKLAKHVQRMVVEAEINGIRVGWRGDKTSDERIAELKQQLEDLK